MKNKKLIYSVTTVIFLLVFLFSLTRLFTVNINPDDVMSKAEWSVLQSVEYENRGKVLTQKVVIYKKNVGSTDYLVLGTLSKENNLVWILLNPKSPPFIKQLPSSNTYVIDKKSLMEVKKLPNINPAVLYELEQHVSK